jgi:hypothetical protein
MHRLAVRTAGPGLAIAPADRSADGPLLAPGAAAAVRPESVSETGASR